MFLAGEFENGALYPPTPQGGFPKAPLPGGGGGVGFFLAPLLGGARGGFKQARIATESCFNGTSSAKPNPRQRRAQSTQC